MKIDLTELEIKIIAKDLLDKVNKLIETATPIEQELGLLNNLIEPRDRIYKKLENALKQPREEELVEAPKERELPLRPTKTTNDIPFGEKV